MKEIIATEQIFSPLSNGKPVAIRYHYQDGSYADAPIMQERKREDLPDRLRRAIERFEERFFTS